MYRRILLAVDGSFHAEAAARYAIHLACACGAELFVVHVGESAAGRESVDRVVWYADSQGLDVHGIVETGAVVPAIEAIVRREQIDLTVASLRHFFKKTIINDLMASLPCSLLAIRVAHLGRLTHLKKILVPVIGGMKSDERAYLTSKLANVFKGTVTALHVRMVSRSGFMGLTHEKKDIARVHARRRVKEFVDTLSSYGVAAEIKTAIVSDATDAIVGEAAAGKYGLIILGASRRDFLKQLIRGNPVERILEKAPCDVVVWRPVK
ncbi:MAG: universal stress protein [Euryarchaeota archaeon]|nr:universal stress protein [Euryarchaeota archaeon]